MIMIESSAAKEKKLIRFPNVHDRYRPMFYVEDGKSVTLLHCGEKITKKCTYLGEHHFNFGTNCYHIDQFAELNDRNSNTAMPVEQITDLSVFRKFYADRNLEGADGKLIPYRSIIGKNPDRYGDPQTILAICPQAEPDRQVVLQHYIKDHSSGNTKVEKNFYSIPEAWSMLLPDLVLSKHELALVSAVFEAHNRQVEHITQKEWDAIGSDFKGTYVNYDGKHPDWVGRKTGFLPGHGTKLFIEGVSFVIDKGKSLDQQIAGAKSRTEQNPVKTNHQEQILSPDR